jgi:hypothetical protein
MAAPGQNPEAEPFEFGLIDWVAITQKGAAYLQHLDGPRPPGGPGGTGHYGPDVNPGPTQTYPDPEGQ